MNERIVFMGTADFSKAVLEMLLNEHYVVMLSKEENLTILNFEYSHNSDRNDVVFQNKEEYEE